VGALIEQHVKPGTEVNKDVGLRKKHRILGADQVHLVAAQK
jgi:hypothetical protein